MIWGQFFKDSRVSTAWSFALSMPGNLLKVNQDKVYFYASKCNTTRTSNLSCFYVTCTGRVKTYANISPIIIVQSFFNLFSTFHSKCLSLWSEKTGFMDKPLSVFRAFGSIGPWPSGTRVLGSNTTYVEKLPPTPCLGHWRLATKNLSHGGVG